MRGCGAIGKLSADSFRSEMVKASPATIPDHRLLVKEACGGTTAEGGWSARKGGTPFLATRDRPAAARVKADAAPACQVRRRRVVSAWLPQVRALGIECEGFAYPEAPENAADLAGVPAFRDYFAFSHRQPQGCVPQLRPVVNFEMLPGPDLGPVVIFVHRSKWLVAFYPSG